MTFTRRGFVKLTALAFLPACGDNIIPPPRGVFFDAHQWATVDAITEFVIPGARAAMAVRYIDRLLAAFDQQPPQIFGGGPFSGREPYPSTDGTPGSVFPNAEFGTFLPLPRVREIAWRMRIYGSAQTDGGDFNDALLGETEGWQQMYAEAIEQLGPGWKNLGVGDQSTVLYTVASALPSWWNAVVEHTLEAMFAAPEYGGNNKLSGWQLAQWDGDSAPLGHAYYDASLGDYRDRADQPTSTASPGAAPEDFDPDVIDVLTVAAIGSGGMRFF